MEQLLETEAVKTSGASGKPSWWRPAAWLLEKKLSRSFWEFFLVTFFWDVGFSVYIFLFNLYLLDYHFNERTMGLVGGAFVFGSVIGTLPAGWLARRTGLRPLLTFCMTAAPLLCIVRTMLMWESAQIGFAFLAGLAMSAWGVCFLPALASLTTEENRASAFSLIFSGSIGFSALGELICGYMPHWLKMAGYALQAAEVKRLLLLASCGIALMGLAPLMHLRLPLQETYLPAQDKNKKQYWKMNPFLLRFLPLMALWTIVLTSFAPFASVYLTQNIHIPFAQIGLIFSAAQMIQLCVILMTPLVFRWLGLVNGIVATQVVTALTFGCLAGTHNREMTIALYLSSTALQWMSSPGLYNLLMSRTPEGERSTAAAMTLFCNALFQSCATAGAGILFTQFGYPRVLVGIAALALVAALLFKALIAPEDQGSAPSPCGSRLSTDAG